MNLPPLALTMGDPAGIGPELTIKAWQAQRAKGQAFFWIGDPELVTAEIPVQEISSPSQAITCFSEALPILPVSCDVPVLKGKAEPGNAKAIINSIKKAVETVLAGEASAVITNPVAKYVLAQAGFSHPGHTEFLAELCSAKGQEIMMLASPQLRIALTSIHLSLKKAIETLSTERIIDVSLCVHKALRRDFGIKNPRLAIAGLNPHAGENGLMGLEEEQIIRPALKVLQEQRITIFGPMPPDTMFSAIMRPSYDAAICLYHDQGLIPLKTLDMENGVNVTLGLPIIRTSPDHGTAFDIAGQDKASASSLLAALCLAADMVRHRFRGEGK